MCVRSLLSNQLTETSYIAKNIKKHFENTLDLNEWKTNVLTPILIMC